MAKLRIGAAIVGLAITAAFALPASAIGSKADCEYEGGTIFNMPDEAVVCVVQIRQEEYRNDEAYDGQQLGVNECNGVELNDGLFCKITLVKGKTPKITPAPTETDTSATMTGQIVEKAKEIAEDEAEKQMKKQAKKKLKNLIK